VLSIPCLYDIVRRVKELRVTGEQGAREEDAARRIHGGETALGAAGRPFIGRALYRLGNKANRGKEDPVGSGESYAPRFFTFSGIIRDRDYSTASRCGTEQWQRVLLPGGREGFIPGTYLRPLPRLWREQPEADCRDAVVFSGYIAVYMGDNRFIHFRGFHGTEGVCICAWSREAPVTGRT
jgi:hypothetical protein